MNPNKCVFGVPSGQLLGFLVSHRGIEASAKQIRAITEMGPPRSVKDVQKLTGCMAALNRFISRLGEKGLPFFKLLKKTDKFEWTEEANEAFKRLKAYLTSSPVLTPPKKYEDMMLYIAATSTVIKYNAPYTTLVKYCQNKKSGIRMCKNYSTPSLSLHASFATILKATRLPW